MKKIISCILICLVCCATICLTGCSNDFAKQEYNDNQKIVQNSERYSSVKSEFKSIDGGYSFTVSKFAGRQNLLKQSRKDSVELEVKFELSISAGYVKVVFIDSNDNLTVLVECTQDGSTEQSGTATVTLTNGQNRFKLVGYDCKDIDLKLYLNGNWDTAK